MELTLGQKIRKIRELKGYNQQYVAKKLNISQEYYSYLENKQKEIPPEYISKIADLFDVSVDFINTFDFEHILGNIADATKKKKIEHGVNKTIITYLTTISLLKEDIAYLEGQVQQLMKMAP
jgi:transcriptional regulator with XRE-family HTH domain